MSSDASSQYLRPGTVVDGYEIQYELGRGAMAIVYLAKQLDLDRPVAFKVLSASLARDKDYVTRFFNEARAAAALSHPSIIQAYKAGITAEGLYYFCMEYVEGETLLDMINENQRVPILQSLTLMTEVAEALEYGWQRYKFTHGDIKPENIMVNMQGKAKLADFGLAKVEGHDYAGNDVMLTPLYAAPELIRSTGNKSDCRSDIYAFGATLYHAIAGTPPFPGNDAQEVLDRHVHENPEPLSNRYQPTPQLLSNLVDRMLIKDPNKRIQNWTEIVAGLRSVTATLTTPQKKKLTLNKSTDSRNRLHQKPQPPQKKGSLLYWIIAAFFTLLLIAMAIILKTSKSSSQKQQPAPLESKLEAAPIQEISLETQQQPPPETAQVAPPSKEIASEKMPWHP